MRSHIVTEGGTFEETLLDRFIKEMLKGQDVRVVAAGGKSNASSLARTFLLDKQEPVALVLDADTVHPDLVRRQRQEFATSLDLVADPSLWTVALFEPEIERCFFRSEPFARELFGDKLTERHLELAAYDPRKVLRELAGSDYRKYLWEKLQGKSLAPLKEDPALRQVVDFLEEVHRRAAA